MGKYTVLYNKWLDHLATELPINQFFISLTRNQKDLEVKYRELNDIKTFTDWLRKMSEWEDSNIGNVGATIFMTAGNDRKTYL